MRIIENKAEYEQLLKDSKSVFVDFYADWCGPCKMVSPLVEKLAEKHTDVAFVKVNVDINMMLLPALACSFAALRAMMSDARRAASGEPSSASNEPGPE